MNPDDIEAALDLDVVENEEERGDGDHLFAKSETEPPSEATSVVDANSLPPPPGAPHAVAPSSKRSFKSDPFLSAGEKPPKRFKSSFIFFSIEKHKEIKDLMSVEGGPKIKNITTAVAEAWRALTPEQRTKFEDMARRDKERYDLEKANYSPPPGVSLTSKRPREPGAPKRPMSAYLAFANERRKGVKEANPDCSNGEISKILSGMWKEIPDDVKKVYKEEEQAKWTAYKLGVKEWRKQNDRRKKANLHKHKPYNEIGQVERRYSNSLGKGRGSRHPEAPFDHEAGFDVHLGLHAMDASGNPNPEEMMAASALRGVRSGPQQVNNQTGDPGQFSSHHPAHGSYGAWFNAMTGMGGSMSGAPMNGTMHGMSHHLGGGGASGHHLEVSNFPYSQQYSNNYSMGAGNQLVAQLRGTQNPYSNLFATTDHQPNLSQLASLAGTHQHQLNTQSLLAPSHNPMGVSLNNAGEAGDGSMLNDNSVGNSMSGGMAPFEHERGHEEASED